MSEHLHAMIGVEYSESALSSSYAGVFVHLYANDVEPKQTFTLEELSNIAEEAARNPTSPVSKHRFSRGLGFDDDLRCAKEFADASADRVSVLSSVDNYRDDIRKILKP